MLKGFFQREGTELFLCSLPGMGAAIYGTAARAYKQIQG